MIVIKSILAGLVRYALASFITWMITNGIATQAQTEYLVGWIVAGLILIGWMAWHKIKSHVKVLTALALPKGTTVDELQAVIKSGVTVDASTPKDTMPVLVKPDNYVTPRMWFLPLLLAASIGVTGCLPKNPPAVVNPAPTEQQIQAVREQAAVLATATREASALAVEARRLAQRAYEAGAIPAATMQQINHAAIVASDNGLAFVEFAKTVTTDPSLKVTARELLRIFDGLIDSLIEGKQGGEAIRMALAAFRSYLGVQ